MMAVPILKDNVDSYEAAFTRGESLPFILFPIKANQEIEFTRNGIAMIRKRGDEKRYFKILVENETSSTVAAVHYLFYSVVNYMADTFHYYPDENDLLTYYTVRLTEPFVRMERQGNAPLLYTIEINCREE